MRIAASTFSAFVLLLVTASVQAGPLDPLDGPYRHVVQVAQDEAPAEVPHEWTLTVSNWNGGRNYSYSFPPDFLVNPLASGNDRNDGETFFAMGDSITSSRLMTAGDALAMNPSDFPPLVRQDRNANGVPDFAEGFAVNLPGGESTYVNLMRDRHAPWASADHSMSGSGAGTAWGVDNLDRYLEGARDGQSFIVLLGNNDYRFGLTPEETADNLVAIHEGIAQAGVRGVWCNLVVPAADHPSAAGFAERVAAIEAAALAHGAVAVPFYDALDIHPYNGQLDAQNPMFFRDAVHPNALGHMRMADMLWSYL